MAKHSSIHPYLTWTKERIDEMDATLASLEDNAKRAKAEYKAKAEQLIAELRKRSDAFKAAVREKALADEAEWEREKVRLESEWNAFQAGVKAYFKTLGEEIAQQQATFQKVAAAQAKAWREGADTLQNAAAKLASARRTDVEAAIKKMQSDAAEADAQLQKMKRLGSESWTAMSAALAESRRSFDRANQQAWDAFKRASSS